MATNIIELINEVITVEGGYSNHPSDTGGETCWGITVEVARKYGYTGLMKNLPKTFAIDVYRQIYWVEPKFITVEKHSALIAAELFDTGVNMGTLTAGKLLQRCLNVFNARQKFYEDLKVDGKLGQKSIDALAAFLKARNKDGERVLLRALNCLQGAYYIELAERREKDEDFVYGWIRNRVNL